MNLENFKFSIHSLYCHSIELMRGQKDKCDALGTSSLQETNAEQGWFDKFTRRVIQVIELGGPEGPGQLGRTVQQPWGPGPGPVSEVLWVFSSCTLLSRGRNCFTAGSLCCRRLESDWRERDQAEEAPQADTGPLREGVKSVVKAADNMLILKVSGHLHVSVVLDALGVPAEAKSMSRAGILSASATTNSLTWVSGCSGDRICVHSVPVQCGVMGRAQNFDSQAVPPESWPLVTWVSSGKLLTFKGPEFLGLWNTSDGGKSGLARCSEDHVRWGSPML